MTRSYGGPAEAARLRAAHTSEPRYTLDLVKRVADHLNETVEQMIERWRQEAAAGDDDAARAVAQFEALERDDDEDYDRDR